MEITVNSALKVGLRFGCVVKPKLCTLTAAYAVKFKFFKIIFYYFYACAFKEMLDNSLADPTNSEHRENEISLVDPSVSNDDGKNLKHRMQYSLQFKANVIYEYEAEQNQTKIGEKFNIDRRLVGDWIN
ncbi:hypothetical protein BpHYR1_028855 [Brachionus plicatilis]|uniref:Brinker DNA-binding domain-containing protein n=1 Tax=Brachionus plicatilis TaxID=10195 RepID=A0A3M7R1C1_BRAPC|nr:hypothetical protein BpHYR1_028855 [Brachionus plicatilis]